MVKVGEWPSPINWRELPLSKMGGKSKSPTRAQRLRYGDFESAAIIRHMGAYLHLNLAFNAGETLIHAKSVILEVFSPPSGLHG